MKLTLNDINSWEQKTAEELLWELIASSGPSSRLTEHTICSSPPLIEKQII